MWASALCNLTLALAVQAALPSGPGRELVAERCLSCHEADLITQQRLGRAGWEREVDKMIRWGAAANASERQAMIDYLAAHFTPRAAAPSRQDDRGKQIYESRCLVCHEDDLTAQQRLARAGWVREVEKMMRWGAAVGDAEKDALVDYLVLRSATR
jgi:cytochrome c5